MPELLENSQAKVSTKSRYYITCPISTLVSFEVEGAAGLDREGVHELALEQELQNFDSEIQRYEVKDMVQYSFLDLAEIEEV